MISVQTSGIFQEFSRLIGQVFEVAIGIDRDIVALHQVLDKRLEPVPIVYDKVSERVDCDS